MNELIDIREGTKTKMEIEERHEDEEIRERTKNKVGDMRKHKDKD